MENFTAKIAKLACVAWPFYQNVQNMATGFPSSVSVKRGLFISFFILIIFYSFWASCGFCETVEVADYNTLEFVPKLPISVTVFVILKSDNKRI